jgi:hypothetical protein
LVGDGDWFMAAYDGGIFLPNKPKHEYFVIHPDWVSESMTIQKLSLSERKPTYVSKTMTWPGRRCKSAPPAKLQKMYIPVKNHSNKLLAINMLPP